jgi:hypothetical protein
MIGTALDIITALWKSKDSDTKYELKEYRKKRSKSQNAYYWSLLGEVARVTGIHSARIHNENLRHLGLVFKVGGELVITFLPDTEEGEQTALESEELHLQPTSQVKDGKRCRLRAYKLLRGSSDFNTAEMSALVDLMIEEAKAQGIETMPPDELARIRQYEQQNEAHQHTSKG